jgi:hypothetical protein
MFPAMDTHPGPAGPDRNCPETAAQRAARLRREADAVAEGLADLAAGRWIEETAVDAWLDALETDPEAPMPTPKGHPIRI